MTPRIVLNQAPAVDESGRSIARRDAGRVHVRQSTSESARRGNVERLKLEATSEGPAPFESAFR
jgi:hypothetical protein